MIHPLLSPEQAADVLGVARSTIYELLAAGTSWPDTGLVCPSDSGRPLHRRVLLKRLHAHLEAAGLPKQPRLPPAPKAEHGSPRRADPVAGGCQAWLAGCRAQRASSDTRPTQEQRGALRQAVRHTVRASPGASESPGFCWIECPGVIPGLAANRCPWLL